MWLFESPKRNEARFTDEDIDELLKVELENVTIDEDNDKLVDKNGLYAWVDETPLFDNFKDAIDVPLIFNDDECFSDIGVDDFSDIESQLWRKEHENVPNTQQNTTASPVASPVRGDTNESEDSNMEAIRLEREVEMQKAREINAQKIRIEEEIRRMNLEDAFAKEIRENEILEIHMKRAEEINELKHAQMEAIRLEREVEMQKAREINAQKIRIEEEIRRMNLEDAFAKEIRENEILEIHMKRAEEIYNRSLEVIQAGLVIKLQSLFRGKMARRIVFHMQQEKHAAKMLATVAKKCFAIRLLSKLHLEGQEAASKFEYLSRKRFFYELDSSCRYYSGSQAGALALQNAIRSVSACRFLTSLRTRDDSVTKEFQRLTDCAKYRLLSLLLKKSAVEVQQYKRDGEVIVKGCAARYFAQKRMILIRKISIFKKNFAARLIQKWFKRIYALKVISNRLLCISAAVKIQHAFRKYLDNTNKRKAVENGALSTIGQALRNRKMRDLFKSRLQASRTVKDQFAALVGNESIDSLFNEDNDNLLNSCLQMDANSFVEKTLTEISPLTSMVSSFVKKARKAVQQSDFAKDAITSLVVPGSKSIPDINQNAIKQEKKISSTNSNSNINNNQQTNRLPPLPSASSYFEENPTTNHMMNITASTNNVFNRNDESISPSLPHPSSFTHLSPLPTVPYHPSSVNMDSQASSSQQPFMVSGRPTSHASSNLRSHDQIQNEWFESPTDLIPINNQRKSANSQNHQELLSSMHIRDRKSSVSETPIPHPSPVPTSRLPPISPCHSVTSLGQPPNDTYSGSYIQRPAGMTQNKALMISTNNNLHNMHNNKVGTSINLSGGVSANQAYGLPKPPILTSSTNVSSMGGTNLIVDGMHKPFHGRKGTRALKKWRPAWLTGDQNHTNEEGDSPN